MEPTKPDAPRGLQRLPGFRRSPHGVEWVILQRLPAVLAWGTGLPSAAIGLLWFMAPGGPAPAADEADRWLLTYQLIGLVVLHWTLVLTVAIGCAIVLVMKGPAYVADPYPPPGRDPLE